jgi:thiosulfate/3-mercaptopyruvate sulfurtransferase
MAGYAHPEVLVETDWLDENRGSGKYKLVEVDVDTRAYDEGHIPGAIAFDWQTELQDRVRRDIPTQGAFEALLGRNGIRSNDTVLLYGDNNNWFAAYAFWVFKIYGHADVRLVNGGRKKWLLEGRKITRELPKVTPVKYEAKPADFALRAFQDDVRAALGRPGLALIDVRSPAEYSGDLIAPPGMAEGAQRAGHIPGAANIPWAQAARDDGSFKSADELKTLYGAKGVTGDKEIVTYCRIGERSSHTWFALKYLLGFERVKNYDGSWAEWGSVIGAPINNPSATAAAGEGPCAS